MIAVIDYGAGNLLSVKKALDYIGAENEITDDPKRILSASHIILPGVGSFGDAVESMKKKGLADVVRSAAENKRFLGICLGLQLLFDSSNESSGVKGLGVLQGDIVKIPRNDGFKVPHIGWNSVDIKKSDGIFKNIDNESYFYFVHSYYLKGAESDALAATADYGVKIECAVEKGLLAAVQFHPEKSGEAGLQLLKNFAESEV